MKKKKERPVLRVDEYLKHRDEMLLNEKIDLKKTFNDLKSSVKKGFNLGVGKVKAISDSMKKLFRQLSVKYSNLGSLAQTAFLLDLQHSGKLKEFGFGFIPSDVELNDLKKAMKDSGDKMYESKYYDRFFDKKKILNEAVSVISDDMLLENYNIYEDASAYTRATQKQLMEYVEMMCSLVTVESVMYDNKSYTDKEFINLQKKMKESGDTLNKTLLRRKWKSSKTYAEKPKPLVWGPSGVGKTDIITKTAEKINGMGEAKRIIVIALNTIKPYDFKGTPGTYFITTYYSDKEMTKPVATSESTREKNAINNFKHGEIFDINTTDGNSVEVCYINDRQNKANPIKEEAGVLYFRNIKSESVTEMAPGDLLPRENDAYPAFMFFDEINRTTPADLGAYMNFILAGEFAGMKYRLPDTTTTFAAANPPWIDDTVTPLPVPFSRRFNHIYLDATFEDWQDWLLKSDKKYSGLRRDVSFMFGDYYRNDIETPTYSAADITELVRLFFEADSDSKKYFSKKFVNSDDENKPIYSPANWMKFAEEVFSNIGALNIEMLIKASQGGIEVQPFGLCKDNQEFVRKIEEIGKGFVGAEASGKFGNFLSLISNFRISDLDEILLNKKTKKEYLNADGKKVTEDIVGPGNTDNFSVLITLGHAIKLHNSKVVPEIRAIHMKNVFNYFNEKGKKWADLLSNILNNFIDKHYSIIKNKYIESNYKDLKCKEIIDEIEIFMNEVKGITKAVKWDENLIKSIKDVQETANRATTVRKRS